MKKTIIVLFLLIYNFSFGQVKNNSIFIRYEEKIVNDETKFETIIDAFLTANTQQSLYEENFIKQNTKTTKNDMSQIGVLKSEGNPYYYTDLKTGLITYNDFIDYGQDVVVKDIASFDWTITGKTRQVLGYHCQEATMHFRSRDYVAYFTVKLPLNAGPWKFRGLPGIILEVKSNDGAFEITAQKIELLKDAVQISWPFGSKNPITFSAFKELYKERYDKLNAFRSENGGRISIPKRRTEQLIEE